jgi:hypothetical protein
MTIAAAAALAALLCVPTLAQSDAGADANQYDARITAVSGEVTVYPADGASDPAAGAEGTLLAEGDRVVVSSDSSAEISLDGSSLITLNAGSDFTLTTLSRAEAKLTLAFGSLIAKIQHLGDDHLQVETPAAVAAVRGTEFGVDFSVDGGEAHVGVFDEGRVEVGGAGGMEVLAPNQETSVLHGERPRHWAPLRRFLARRELMRASVRRLAVIHRRWRRIPPGMRRALRRNRLARQRQAYRARPHGPRGPRGGERSRRPQPQHGHAPAPHRGGGDKEKEHKDR